MEWNFTANNQLVSSHSTRLLQRVSATKMATPNAESKPKLTNNDLNENIERANRITDFSIPSSADNTEQG